MNNNSCIIPSGIFVHEATILLHAVNIENGTPGCNTLPEELVLQIIDLESRVFL